MGAEFVQGADYFFVGNLALTAVLRCAKIILLSAFSLFQNYKTPTPEGVGVALLVDF
jgi:hypothetical protein